MSLLFTFFNYSKYGLTVDTSLAPLFLLHKKILGCIKFHPVTKLSAPLFFSLEILRLEDLIHLNTLYFIYKAINKLGPFSFHNYFAPDFYVHRYGTRQKTWGDL